jgi:hypothetical protein
MLSLPAVAATPGAGASADVGVAEGVVGGVAFVSADGALSGDGAALAPSGVGVVATSPALTPERGASLTQAVTMARERTPRRVERT